jgi:hypothetical protein
MRKSYDYEKLVKLKHHEAAAKINLETGEVTKIPDSKKNNVPKGKTLVNQKDFSKVNNKVIPFLRDNLSNTELSIIFQMIGLTEFNTNSLKPLSNETALKDLAEQFDVGINQVKKYFKNLFDLGVYAQFKIAKNGEKEFWILSPYISFKGNTAEDSIFTNFEGTKIEKFVKTLTF